MAVYARTGEDEPWTRHATGSTAPESLAVEAGELAGAWPPPGSTPVDLEDFYQRSAESGFGYGPVFQGLTRAWRHNGHIWPRSSCPRTERGRDGGSASTPRCSTRHCTPPRSPTSNPPNSAGCRSPSTTSPCTPPARRPCGSGWRDRARLRRAGAGRRDRCTRSLSIGSLMLRPVPEQVFGTGRSPAPCWPSPGTRCPETGTARASASGQRRAADGLARRAADTTARESVRTSRRWALSAVAELHRRPAGRPDPGRGRHRARRDRDRPGRGRRVGAGPVGADRGPGPVRPGRHRADATDVTLDCWCAWSAPASRSWRRARHRPARPAARPCRRGSGEPGRPWTAPS